MGCDIHLYKEKQIDGKWVTADIWSDPYQEGLTVAFQDRFTGRNYDLFALLAKGVRGKFSFSFLPRGLPFNVCDAIKSESDSWDGDGHNHSYLYLHELRDLQAFLPTSVIPISGMKNKEGLVALHASIASDGDTDWNLLYPYCGWTNSKDAVEFSVDVPAEFVIGGSIEEIISGFDGIDGENHRIVFWFDN